MPKASFGDLLRAARRSKGYSLRDLAQRTGMNYSRLSRIEHGTRPAPGLPEIRLLADLLDIEMSELLIATGTPREVMEHLLWSERLQAGVRRVARAQGPPTWTRLAEKNRYRVPVLRRHGAGCVVALGAAELAVFYFGSRWTVDLFIPPEAVMLFRDRPDGTSCTAGNVLPVRVVKQRRLGGVVNLVLRGDGFELNSLHAEESVAWLSIEVGERVFASVQPATMQAHEIKEA